MTDRHKLDPKNIKHLVAGRHNDGGGLWLHLKAKTKGEPIGKWVLRVMVNKKRRDMGLGSYPDVSVKAARLEAEKWRALAKDKERPKDPIVERAKERQKAIRNLDLLADVASDAFESRKAELKGDGKAGRWFSPLELHVLPKLGHLPIAEVSQIDIRETLAPIWHTKADTARKAMNRLAIVLKHAAALGLDVDLQAVDKAKALLGKTRHQPKNVPALRWQDVPDFYKSLDEGTTTHLALRLLILTGVRSKPLRFLHVDQVTDDIWTIPADVMKGRKGATSEFRVPLSGEALDVIAQARPFERDGFLFPSVRKGVISDATMSRFMERRGMVERPHGFRTSLRTWLADCTDAPHEVAESVLAHTVGGTVERAYRRTDFLEQRRMLMERWAGHVSGTLGAIVRLQGSAQGAHV